MPVLSFFDKITLYGLFLILLTGFTLDYTTHTYVIFIIILFFFALHIFQSSKLTFYEPVLISTLFLLIWLYGLLLGILSGNNIDYIIRNFAGLLLYLMLFPLALVKYDARLYILKILIRISIFNSFFSIAFAAWELITIPDMLERTMGSGQPRFYYFLNMPTFFIGMIYGFIYLFLPKNMTSPTWEYLKISKLKAFFIFNLSILAVLLSASKGFTLATVVLLSIALVAVFRKHFFSFRVISFLFILCGLSIILLYTSGYFSLFASIFSSQDIGNQVRYEQFNLLFQNMSLFGAGLGGEIPNNITGNTYGFELSYLNLFHKFGIFALIVIMIYGYSFFQIAQIFKTDVSAALLLFSMLMYLIPSIGNPVLFSPINVVLHILVLHLSNHFLKMKHTHVKIPNSMK